MALWNPNKNPDHFPKEFALALECPGEFVIGCGKDAAEADLIRRKFSAFRASVRNFPGHRLYLSLDRLKTRTSLRSLPGTGVQVIVTTTLNLTNFIEVQL